MTGWEKDSNTKVLNKLAQTLIVVIPAQAGNQSFQHVSGFLLEFTPYLIRGRKDGNCNIINFVCISSFIVVTDSGRPHARIGGLKKNEAKKEDGLR